MHNPIKKYEDICNSIKLKLEAKKISKLPKIIAVSKTFGIEKILPLIEYGHLDYGENKVQEAEDKWTKIKIDNPNIKLHMIGKLQTNKVKFAVKIFDFIHSVDSLKLAKKISDEQIKQKRKLNLFIQVNIGSEDQKAGINKNELVNLCRYCNELNLNVIGLMCIPPANEEVEKYFKQTNLLNKQLNFSELSMGMSSDYLKAVEHSSSYLRIGSSIFGKRI
jgi:PLP dependent protein